MGQFYPTNGPYISVSNNGDGISISFYSGGREIYEGIYPMSEKLLGRDGKVYKNDSDFLSTWR